MGYKLNQVVDTEGLPVKYIQNLLNNFSIPTFIETGTAGGASVRAASTLFTKCHTIEIVPDRAAGSYPENVLLYTGSSPAILPSIIGLYSPKQYIFFWLDAHYSEPTESAPEVVECPLIEEIQAIKSHEKAVIMIDDARLFLAPPKWPCDYTRWPAFSAVFNTLLGCFPNHFVTVIDDYIVCVPGEMKEMIRIEWWNNMEKRFPSESDKVKSASKLAYENLMKYLS